MPNSAAAPLVAVDRGDVREATHAGHLVVVDGGRARYALGDAGRLTYFRSSAKPFQALAGLRTGAAERFQLSQEQVAIMCASHSGEARHVATVRSLLQRAGIPENKLQCGAHWPINEAAADAARREMAEPLAVHNNCSGKHAGMLASASALGAPLETYLDPRHSVQQRIRETIAEFTGHSVSSYGIDGCSAPNPAVPLETMARGFVALARSASPEARRVVDAMTGDPFLVAGTGRLDTRLMEVSAGRIVAKGGAAGLHCSADRRSGQGLVVKLESGDGAWIGAAVVAAMVQLGWLDSREVTQLASFQHPVLRNHRQVEVGRVQAIFELPV